MYYVTLYNTDQGGSTVALWQLGGVDALANDAVLENGDSLLLSGGSWGTPNYAYPPYSEQITEQLSVLLIEGIPGTSGCPSATYETGNAFAPCQNCLCLVIHFYL